MIFQEEKFSRLPSKKPLSVILTEALQFFCNLKLISFLPDKTVEQTNFMFLKAFFTKDMSEIENDEWFIGIFYKDPEPTGNDVPDNLEVTGHENQVDDSFMLANLVRRSSKIKSKRKLRQSLISESHC